MSLFFDSPPAGESELEILGARVRVVRKRQKNMYLSVRPDGSLRVTCPPLTRDSEIVAFVQSQAGWLRKRREAAAQRAKTGALDYANGDAVPLWGRFYPLDVRAARPYGVSLRDGRLVLAAPESSTRDERAALVESFYRAQMKAAVPPLLRKWQTELGVQASSIVVRSMTSRWGSCNTRTGRVCLNLRLVGKDPRCLEYVVVHELCHLIVPDHSVRFWNCVARCVPNWRELRALTNEAVKEPMDE
ncbi:MAG: M48 family metallopeptidase [Pyramidobacter sp.]|nr:M48 family metallopeptidase [Pyramidobacter sp.]